MNAGGIYANQIGRLAGVEVPVVPFAHQYLLTKPVEGGSVDLPTMRDPDRLVYFRGEAGGGLVMGGYERNPAPWAVEDGPPADFNHQLLPDDWERFESLAENAFGLVPVLQTAEVVTMINGPEAFTPDGEFILGESDVRGFFVAAGFCAHGIAGAGGIGKVMADWIVHGEPEYDLWKMDIRRFGAQYRSRHYARERAYEVYATYYDIHYPGEERQAGRPLKTAPTYAPTGDARRGVRREVRLGARELVRVERGSVVRAAAPARMGRRALVERDRGRAHRHARARRPVRRVELREDRGERSRRGGVPPAAVGERRRSADRARSTYTQMLNARGGIECDLTVTRLADDRYVLVTGTAFGNHDIGWIRKQLGDGRVDDVTVRDVDRLARLLRPVGPARSRHLVERHARRPLERGVPVHDRAADRRGRRAVPRAAGDLRRRARAGSCIRTWSSRALWDTLVAAGEPHGMTPAGYRAIDSLRLEKGYRAWGSDITPEEHPFEAGLGFAVRMDVPGFIGNEALEQVLAARA